MRIQGGPIGGQYHGFIGPDETEDYMGWPAGPREMIRPMDDPRGLGAYPWEHWDKRVWGGTPLMEGDSVSDYVYRGPAEVRPRPNASGGVNTVRAVQLARTAGFAVAPGNYRTLGALIPVDQPVHPVHPFPLISPDTGPIHQVCPAWGCGGPPTWMNPLDGGRAGLPPPWAIGPVPVTQPISPAPSPTVPQPPPPTGPAPVNVVPMGPPGSDGCAQGQYRDSAGNCTSDWHNPYSMYLPLDSTPAPAPTVSANTCPTGFLQDPNGNCVTTCPAGTVADSTGNCVAVATGTGITGWLGETTSLFGYNIPNWGLGVGFLGLWMLMSRGGGRRR